MPDLTSPDLTLPDLTLFDAELQPAVLAGPVATPAARPRARPAQPPAGPTLLAVDGDSLAHRAFHAYPAQELTASDGRPRGAVYGFLALLSGI